jgi:hypothetical protein
MTEFASTGNLPRAFARQRSQPVGDEIIEHRISSQSQRDGDQQDRFPAPVDTEANHYESQWCKDEKNHGRVALYQEAQSRHAPPGLEQPRAEPLWRVI